MQKQSEASRFFRFRQPIWVKRWLEPRATEPIERFCETVMRAFLPIGAVCSLLMIPTIVFYYPTLDRLLTLGISWFIWFLLIFVIYALGMWCLSQNKRRAAMYLTILAYFIATCGMILLADDYSAPDVMSAFMIEFLVCAMIVFNRKMILPIAVISILFIALVVAYQRNVMLSAGQTPPFVTYDGALLSLLVPFILEALIVGVIRQEVDSHLIALDKARATAETASHAKSEFLAMMSHELRTPLALIDINTDNLVGGTYQDGKPATLQQLPSLQTVKRSTTRLLGLLDNLFEYIGLEREASLPEGQIEPINFAFFENILIDMKPLADAKGLALKLSLSPGALDNVMSDLHKVQQVIINLIDNAIKFTDAGSVEIRISRTDTCWNLVVRDTGVGIPSDDTEKIFNDFFQVERGDSRRYKGMGLGLTIVKSIVKQLGGTIAVTSELNKGSVFTVMLPLAKEMKRS